jgi:hypothetical protein
MRMTENSGGEPGGWERSGYGGFYAPPAGAAPPTGPSGGGPTGKPSATDALAFGWRMVFGDFGRVALPIVVAFVAYVAAVTVLGMLTGAIAGAVASASGVHVEPQLPQNPDPSQFGEMWVALMKARLPVMAIQMPLNIIAQAPVNAFFLAGIFGFALRTARGERPEFAEVFGGMKYFVPMLIAGLLVQLVNFIATLACIIPAFIVYPATSLYVFCVIDRGASGTSALADSWRLTRGSRLTIFGFYVLATLLMVACLIACCVPVLLVAMPVYVVGLAHIYASITGQIAAPPLARQS